MSLNLKPGDIIKHKEFKDVAIQVFYIRKEPINDIIEIDGVWFNLGVEESYLITSKDCPYGYPARINISSENKNKWFKCKSNDAKCYRYEDWELIK